MLSLRRDGLLRFARNDGSTPELSLLFEIRVPSLRGGKRRSNPCSLCGEMDCFASLAMTAQHLNCLCCLKLECRHCEERSDEAIHALFAARWIASRSLSSGAHSRDPLARNDGSTPELSLLFEIRVPSLRGAKRRSNPCFLYAARWIASRSPSSGAHLRDPLARNDGSTPGLSVAV